MRGLWKHFIRDQRGAVAILVGAGIAVFVGFVGLSTDTARGYMVKAKLSEALDAAGLAGGKTSDQTLRAADIDMFFKANFPPGFMGATVDGPHLTQDVSGDTLSVTATAIINTTFMRVLGFNTLTVAAATEIKRELTALDVVLSMDVSGSMGSPLSKMTAAKAAANSLIDYLFKGATSSPTTIVDGQTYELLHVGLVPWNQGVNVARNGVAFSTVTKQAVSTFTNPVTNQNQSFLYFANNSPVPLLNDPRCWNPSDADPTNCANKDTTWAGAVYQRYTDDDDQTNDGEFALGDVTVGGKQWFGFEAAPNRHSQPRSSTWPSGSGSGPSGSWQGYSRQCYAVYWESTALNNSNYPTEVPDKPSWYIRSRPSYSISQNGTDSYECVGTPTQGITALTPTKSTITTAIGQLTPNGGTMIAGGLYWAWEVLMPGGPYAEAAASVPFPRTQAIVLFTDGENESWFGDIYRMSFGKQADIDNNHQHGYLPSPPAAANTWNTVDDRLIQLAATIKAQGVAIYVVKYQHANAAATAVMQQVASGTGAPFYFDAANSSELESAFQQIATHLSKLRISK